MATTAPNLQAIKQWFVTNRPDINPAQVEQILEQDAFILIAAGAFEAGREFQQRNPGATKFLDPGKTYA